MTIDAMIEALQALKAQLPSGGETPVVVYSLAEFSVSRGHAVSAVAVKAYDGAEDGDEPAAAIMPDLW